MQATPTIDARTLDLYTRRTDNSDRILQALNDPGEEDPDDEAGPVPVSQ
jgi:hypothetical protein